MRRACGLARRIGHSRSLGCASHKAGRTISLGGTKDPAPPTCGQLASLVDLCHETTIGPKEEVVTLPGMSDRPGSTAPDVVSGERSASPAWRTVNITPVERLGRVLVGLAAAVIGLVLLASAPSVWAVVLEVLLVLAGLDLLVTGAIGHCPLYQKLGYRPRSLRESR